jgi:trigger factor
LKIELEPRENQQMQMVVDIDRTELDRFKRTAARKLAQKSKIPGFRPGKAPYEVILRHFGEAAIEQDAIEALIDDTYPKALEQAALKPSGPGSLEALDDKDPIHLVFVVPLEPEVVLGDYHAIRQDYTLEPVTEKDVDEFIKRLRTSYATAEPVERPAAKGDLVAVHISGVLQDAKEGEIAEVLKDTPSQAVVGDDTMDGGFPFPGFSKELVGLKAGDVKDVSHKFSKESEFEKLRGRKVNFTITVESVKVLHQPDLDDAFAQSVGEFENLEALRQAIHDQIETSRRDEYESGYFDTLFDALAAIATVKYPPHMLEEEIGQVIESIEHDLSHHQRDLPTYLKEIGKEEAAWIEEDIKPIAEKRLKRSLILDEISRKEAIELAEDELKGEFDRLLSNIIMSQDFQTLRKKYSTEHIVQSLSMQAATALMSRKVRERLKAIATGTFTAEEKPAKKAKKKKGDAEVEAPAAEEIPAKPVKKAKKTAETLAEAPVTEDKAAEKPAKKVKKKDTPEKE